MTDLSVRVDGRGHHPLVLIHAAVAGKAQWEPLTARLAPRWRVIAYDARGFGDSPDPRDDYYDHLDLLEVMDAVAAERAVLVGASNGGRIAADAAAEAPERVAGLVLLDAALPRGERGPEMQRYARDEERLHAAGDVDGVVELGLEVWIAGRGRDVGELPSPLVRTLRTWLADSARRERTAFAHGEPKEIAPPLIDRLGTIRMPAQVAVGEHDQPTFHSFAATYARELADAAGPRLVRDAAHLPAFERPGAVAELVTTFLERIGWTA